MKRNKKFSVILGTAAAICLFSTMKVCGEEYCETLKYIIREDKAVITGYTGSPEVLIIPEKIEGKDVVGIRENAFYKCESLKEVSIPENVSFIGHHTFFECTSLEKVELSENLCSMGEGAFSGCISLSEIKLPENLKTVEEKSFYNCVNLKTVNCTRYVEDIENYAFANCFELENIYFGEKLMSIGDYAFAGCKNLDRVYIPDSVIDMGCCSFGYYDGSSKADTDFLISGSKNSLGKLYALNNNMKFENISEESNKENHSSVPAAATILSGAGLLLLRPISKINVKTVKRRSAKKA